MKFLVLVLAAITFGGPLFADPNGTLSDAGYLRKLSFQLRGTQPSQEEYSALGAIRDPGARSQFLDSKINEYLATTDYQDHMTFRLAERFQIITPALPQDAFNAIPPDYYITQLYMDASSTVSDSLTSLFRDLTAKNLSWDKLLTGKEYTLYSSNPGASQGDARDFEFYKYVTTVKLPENEGFFGMLAPKKKEAVQIQFDEKDPRIAGALTTPRFLNRYNTTNINRNRRRAAAVFRIFMCDPMSPSIPPAADKKGAVLNEPFGENGAVDGHAHVDEKHLQEVLKLKPEDRHGSDKQCAACHYKLDPLGRTFQNIGIVLNPLAAPGALIFNRVVGQSVNVKVAGLGPLGEEITKQPEYANCQVEFFWQQFIGKDVVLNFNRRAELVKAFDDVGRRTNDFVRVLVKAPEFRQRPPRVSRVQYAQVAPLLQRCDSCHNGEEIIGPLSQSKIGRWDLLDARSRLNLPENAKGKMPRNWATWNPEDLNLLRRWIDEGAVGADDKPQLNAQDLGGN